MKNLKQIIRSRKVQAIFVISIAIILEIVFSMIYHSIRSETEYIECLYYSSQIIGGIFVISGVVIAVWQYYLSSKSSRTTLEVTQVQKAIDLAEYYKDNILSLYPAIRYVFDKTDISKIFQSIKISDMNDFDNDELTKLLTPEQIQKLKDIQRDDIFFNTVQQASLIYNLDIDLQLLFTSKCIENSTKEENEKMKEFIKQTMSSAFIRNYIQTILNNMEFFAMHFKHKTADETVVYQSLHQSYLEIVTALYYFICKQNTEDTSKYYTNIIWLYNEWSNQKNEKKQKQKEQSQKTISDGTIIKKII